MFSPVQVLAKLHDTSPAVANFLYAGVGVFAAVAVVLSFKIDLQTAISVAAVILVFALVVVAFSRAPGLLTTVLAWGMVILLLLTMSVFVYAASVNDPSPIRPVECLVRFWERCDRVQDEVASRNEPVVAINEVVTPPETPSVDKSKFSVFIQFAGFRREDVADAAKALTQVGWKIPEPERGGERTGNAAGLSEVRYHSDAQEAAARLLASEIEATGIRAGVRTVKVSAVRPEILEVWISL